MMPVLISNGKHYRMPFFSLLRGSVREERPWYGTQSASGDRYQDVSRISSRRGRISSAIHTIPWTTDDDRLLRELRASKVSWKRISMVLDDRPVGELKRRWIHLQDGRHRLREVYELDEDDHEWYYDDGYDAKERHVSFRTSFDEEEYTDDEEEIDSRRTKTKKVYYIDDVFTLDEVLLLHQIAEDWKKDRWETISSRFNNKTGRNITPAQAKSALDD
ncbi:hypothetical protein BDV12DRAFT_172802 [Aspergillus spectabilis]